MTPRSLGALIGDHAVLQRGARLHLDGTGEPGVDVTVSYGTQTWSTRADADGRWRVVFGPLPPCDGEAFELRIGAVVTRYRDVAVGDVWVCSGQSNMAMALQHATDGAADAAAATDPGIRLMTVPQVVADQPLTATDGLRWSPCAPDVAAAFPALAYYCARALRRSRGVCIGLIHAAVGNTPCEAWMPREVLDADPIHAPYLARWRQSLADFPDTAGQYAATFAEWDRAADAAERAGRRIPGTYPKLIGPGHPWTPTGLYNGMIAPLTQIAVAGIWWYQGAAQPERAAQYREIFPSLIRSWRRAWQDERLPFIYAQEANFGPRRDAPGEHSWAELREAQTLALSEPATAMAVAIDLGEADDIHPPRKAELGERLALAVRAVAWQEDVDWSGPVLDEMRIDGDTVRLHFRATGGGLRTSDGRAPVGFALSGGGRETDGDRGFVWADAEIDGDDVILRAPGVPQPVAARYAWAQNPDCNLLGNNDLPARPFRTDTWPGVTDGNL